jgi:hypothetical protein
VVLLWLFWQSRVLSLLAVTFIADTMHKTETAQRLSVMHRVTPMEGRPKPNQIFPSLRGTFPSVQTFARHKICRKKIDLNNSVLSAGRDCYQIYYKRI